MRFSTFLILLSAIFIGGLHTVTASSWRDQVFLYLKETFPGLDQSIEICLTLKERNAETYSRLYDAAKKGEPMPPGVTDTEYNAARQVAEYLKKYDALSLHLGM
ncbi:hypothetical protein BC835DRAFT_996606 [Cytidiella melzeri]|nr:hypothetical protein BC835DRAFT_996606 [Cytidiella melzeri]